MSWHLHYTVLKILLVSLFFSAFQEHTERMRKTLANQRQQEVDDEDDRIAKAVADRERKREVCACFVTQLFRERLSGKMRT